MAARTTVAPTTGNLLGQRGRWAGVRIHIEVHGCAVTQSEGSSIRALLERAGHRIVDEPEPAEAAVLVTCTVVGRTERRMRTRLRTLQETVGTLVVTGCMAAAQRERVLEGAPHALVLPPHHLDQVVPLIEEGRFTPSPVDKAGLPHLVEDGIATVVINDGCLGKCTFCITKLARPGLRSYPAGSIVEAVEKAVAAGATEVRLTSMDTGAYGRDVGSDLPSLLEAVADVPGDFRVRLGMLNPFLGVPFLDELLEVLRDGPFYHFLHVPVQSGSDRVLAAMDRHHTADDLVAICKRAREVLDEPTIATDVVVGYPTETEEDHRATVELLEATRPGHVNVTRFSPRPGTPAAGLDRLDGALVKDRSRELSALRDRLQQTHRGRLTGRTVACTAVEVVVPGTVQARTRAYDPVVLPAELPPGTRVEARITGSTPAHAVGEIVHVERPAAPAGARVRA